MAERPDLVIVGSGPSGAQAARAAVDRGLSVTMVDVGHRDDSGNLVPDRPFDDIRRSDPEQWRYFVGERETHGTRQARAAGGQLTPPRQFLMRDVERLLPLESETFRPLLSLALGGLGAGWGAGTQTFEAHELEEIGLPGREMRPYYDAVAADIGISGALDCDTSPMVLDLSAAQPPLELDDNARSIYASYLARRNAFRRMGFTLGPTPLAILSQPHPTDTSRHANPYHDMDFYSDHRRSVYRPRFTIEALSAGPGFTYRGGLLATRFIETPDGVRLVCRHVASGREEVVDTRALAIGAGAVNTARLVLQSADAVGTRVPLLCNRYDYVAALNLRMLGRPASARRYSMSQLTGVLTDPADARADRAIVSLFSYRSLLLFRLARELPVPTWLGVQMARLIESSLTILGVHHVDRTSADKWVELRARTNGEHTLAAQWRPSEEDRARAGRNLRHVRRVLWKLGCVPLSALSTSPGSSIHYAGTLPVDDDGANPRRCGRDGRLGGTSRVYVVDSASWRALPAKGPTFTEMANARRVIDLVARRLAGET